ncbi:hypothetical protein DPMN_047825 [Dreissena polymorpha]|uniref:Uncharacterized protein n=1 Tax=Dreissena polymorpha TaxID=45954 RepID=A0A9D4D9G5_DREPO|nr:hypothetical protein DPMN_047825 [Dreissena polymorpha]
MEKRRFRQWKRDVPANLSLFGGILRVQTSFNNSSKLTSLREHSTLFGSGYRIKKLPKANKLLDNPIPCHFGLLIIPASDSRDYSENDD